MGAGDDQWQCLGRQARREVSFVDGSEQRALLGELAGIDTGAQEADQDDGGRYSWRSGRRKASGTCR